ncbi:MAG: hypothetical protein LW860_10765 [Xanthomonadaceae bacterium]|nr:hypothetical protein [Xanthomonadaceae bacterium]
MKASEDKSEQRDSATKSRFGLALLLAASALVAIAVLATIARNDTSSMPLPESPQRYRADQQSLAAKAAETQSTEDVDSAENAAVTKHSASPGDTNEYSRDRLTDRRKLQRTLSLAASADSLPSERALVVGNALDVAVVGRALLGTDFRALVSNLYSESSRDVLASDLTQAYADAVRLQLRETGGKLDLSSLVCGLKVCVGEFAPGATDADIDSWQAAFARDQRTPHGVFASASTSAMEGQGAYRFVFSTDPATRSATAPLYP